MTDGTQDDKRVQFMELYQPLHARLSRFVYAQVWDREDARDIISETALKAFEGFGRLRNRDAFLSFLFSIASALVKKRIRRKKFWGVFEQEKAESIPLREKDLEILELSRLLRNLSPEQREAISLFEISGFSIREIAALQKTSESNVKSRLVRARSAILEMLEKDEKRLLAVKQGFIKTKTIEP